MYSHNFLKGGGEMGQITRTFNWSESPLGEPSTWPQSLRTTLSILLNSKFPMFLFWGQDLICFYNDAYRPSLGNNGKHPAVGMRGEDLWPEIWHFIKPIIDQVLQGGDSAWYEDQFLPIFRNGRLEDVYWTFSYSAVYDETGKPAGVIVVCTETTEKVKLVNHLRISDQRFQNLVREATVGIVVLIGEDLIVEIVNEAYGKLIGRTPDQLISSPLFSIIPELEDPYRNLINKVITSGEPIYMNEEPYQVNSNEKMISGYLNIIYQPYKEPDGTITGVMALCQNITEQVTAKMKLEEAEERTRLAVDAASLGTFDVNLKTKKIIASKRLDEIMGVNSSSVHTDYFSTIHPDDLTIREEAFREAMQTGKLHYIIRVIKDKAIRWIQAEGKVYYDEAGHPNRLLGSMQDITEQKIAQQQKDDFISIASHELKTPITTLKASLQLLKRMKDNPSSRILPKLIDQSDKSMQKISSLVEDLLHVSRINEGQLQLNRTLFNVTAMLEDCCQHVRVEEKHKLIIEGERYLEVYADENRVDQVVINLINNAVKYASNSIEIYLTVEKDDQWAKVSVKDNGPGIAHDKQAYLFDRYYQSDVSGHHTSGLGLGLYISSEIIKKHGGEIGVSSEPGKGSTFWFTLPLPH